MCLLPAVIFGGSAESILVNYIIIVVSTEEGLFSSVNTIKPAAILSLLLDTFFRMNSLTALPGVTSIVQQNMILTSIQVSITQYSNNFRLSSLVFCQKPRNTHKGLRRLINSHNESIQINHDLFIVQLFKCNFLVVSL